MHLTYLPSLSAAARCLASVVLASACAAASAPLAAPGPAPSRTVTGVSREHEIKAAALYNIIAFTDWPSTAFATPETPLVIGVLGRGPVATLLGGMVENETWHGRKVVLQNFATPADIQSCHVVFIVGSERGGWPSMRNLFQGRPILTVADEEGFAQQGGVVQFSVDRNKLRLVVNLRSARANGITISSKVLRLAEVIGAPGE